jgi:hypothetical protein
MHTCMIWYLASRAYPYRFCKLASRVRIAVYCFLSSVHIRTCANFCTALLGTPPKPRDRTSCELRIFAKHWLLKDCFYGIPNSSHNKIKQLTLSTIPIWMNCYKPQYSQLFAQSSFRFSML